MKKNRTLIIAFTLPCVLSLSIMYLYPVIRTVIMSFFQIESVTASVSEWSFYGLGNYTRIFDSAVFRTSIKNMALIWFVGGVITLSISLFFAVILSGEIRFKKFFRAAIYLPNVISAVALGTMWTQYIYSREYGLLNKILNIFGVEPIKWLSMDLKFWAMLAAFIFGGVGYYMLIFISGIERIPRDFYEAAIIDGASGRQQFLYISLPLLKSIIKTNITFWTVGVITFFAWSKVFSPLATETATVTPVVYLMDIVFGTKGDGSRDAGGGAAVGVILTICITVVYFVLNKLFKEEELEF